MTTNDNAAPQNPAPTPAAPEAPDATPPAAGPVALSAEEYETLRKKAEERDQLWDRLLRTHAEFENWRKRIERESRTSVRFALQEFVQDLLPIIDNFDRAIRSAESGHAFEPLLDGVKLVQKQIYDALRANDIVPISTAGEKFDPAFHEAVSMVPSADKPAFTILEEVARGFRMHDRVIRPAQVVVSAAPAAGAQSKGE